MHHIEYMVMKYNRQYAYSNGRVGGVCSKTCLVGLSIRSTFAGQNARALQRKCSFSSEKSGNLTDQQDMFCFNHASAFYTSNNIEK